MLERSRPLSPFLHYRSLSQTRATHLVAKLDRVGRNAQLEVGI